MPLLPQLTVPGPPFASTSRQERQGLCRAGVKVSEISGSVLRKHSGAAPPAVEFQVGHGRVCAELATARSSSLPSAVPGQRLHAALLLALPGAPPCRCPQQVCAPPPGRSACGLGPRTAAPGCHSPSGKCHPPRPRCAPLPRDPARPEAWALGAPPPTSLSCWAPRPGERVVTVLILD